MNIFKKKSIRRTRKIPEDPVLKPKVEVIKDRMIQFAAFFTQKDAEGIGTLLSDDFSLYDPALKWIHGKGNVLDILRKQFKELDEVDYRVINAYEDGETGILEFHLILGDLELFGVDFMEWKDGKMRELRCYYNPPQNEVLKPFSSQAKSLIPGSIYEHYKGNRYQLVSVGRHSETLEESVIYQEVEGGRETWVRPLKMFLEEVEVQGTSVPRFKQVSKEELK